MADVTWGNASRDPLLLGGQGTRRWQQQRVPEGTQGVVLLAKSGHLCHRAKQEG